MTFNTLIKMGRNELCPCGSNKKFKKCCLVNNNQKITSYEITSDAMPELDSDNGMSFSDQKIYNKIGEQISRRDILDYQQTAKTLSELKDKYPTARRLYNLLGICYQMTGEKERSENLIIETYTKFPNYLFARTGYVSHWMHKGDYTKFDEVFSNCYDLKSLYPNRIKFHISEALSFFTVCGRYFANKGNIKSAENYLNMARELRSDDPHLELIENEIMLANIRNFSELAQRKNNNYQPGATI